MTSCRAVFKKDEKFLVNKRIKIDSMVAKIPKIKFFLSCITGTATSGKEKKGGISPGISYVIVSEKENTETSIFAKFHDLKLDFELRTIKFRSKKKEELLKILSRSVKVRKTINYLF